MQMFTASQVRDVMDRRGTGMTARRGRRSRMLGERGGAAVEAAIVTPVILAMLFGIIELGFLFKDYLAVAGAVRAGARIASANPRRVPFAQVAADKVAATGTAANLADVLQMWVYKVDPLPAQGGLGSDKPINHTTFDDCDVCVKFRWDTGTRAFVQTSNTWASTTQNACSSSSPGGPPDRIGVYVKLKHNAFTKFVFNTITISEASILTLEPMPLLTGCK